MTVLTPEEWSALTLSLRVASVGCLLCLLPGVAVGWLLARRSFPGKVLLDALVHLPLVLPPVAVGYLLLLLLGHHGVFGTLLTRLDVQIAFTWRAAAIASAVMGFPLLVRAVRLAVEMIDPGLEAAARTLGVSPAGVLTRVTLPLAAPGLLSGAILCFVRSLGEFGATITVAGNIPDQTRTLPVAIYTYTQTPGGDAPATRLMVLSIAVSLLALLASEWMARRTRVGKRPA
jgi:molybdate transport system permease protein